MYELTPISRHDETYLKAEPLDIPLSKSVEYVQRFLAKQQNRLIYVLTYGFDLYKKFNLNMDDFGKEDIYNRIIDEFNNRTVKELLSSKFNYSEILLWKENISEEEKSKIDMILELRK